MSDAGRSLRRAAAAALLCIASAAPGPAASAVDWPVAPRIVVSTFGASLGGTLSQGIDIAAPGAPVRPALDGELVFAWDGGWSSVPRGTGLFAVLRHGQDLLTLYAHLAAGTMGGLRTVMGPRDTIGRVGDTGRAPAAQLHFGVYDGEVRAWLNPLAFLPPLPDRQAPVVRRILLSAGDQLVEPGPGVRVTEGRYVVLVEAWDLREDVRFTWPMAPYAVSVSVEGRALGRVTFDSLGVRQGRQVLGAAGADLPVAVLPAARREPSLPGLLSCGTADLRPGPMRIEAEARDFAGNVATREVAFTVDAR